MSAYVGALSGEAQPGGQEASVDGECKILVGAIC
jgi:hypothetical protein